MKKELSEGQKYIKKALKEGGFRDSMYIIEITKKDGGYGTCGHGTNTTGEKILLPSEYAIIDNAVGHFNIELLLNKKLNKGLIKRGIEMAEYHSKNHPDCHWTKKYNESIGKKTWLDKAWIKKKK